MPAHLFDSRPNVNQTYHVDSNLNEYFGDAPRGAKTSDAKWRIYKIEYVIPGNQDSSWVIKYPNGSDMPVFVWDNAQSYDYDLLKER